MPKKGQSGCQSEGDCGLVLPSNVTMAIQRASSGAGSGASGSGGLPRIAVAVGIGLAAVGVGIARRLVVGATRRTPPVPEKRPHGVQFGNVPGQDVGDRKLAMSPPQTLMDDYFYLRDDSRKNPAVLKHLREENAYTNYKTLPLRGYAKRLYAELLSHTKETDIAVPAKYGPFVYYTRTLEGSSYVFHCRKPILEDGKHGEEQVILDENEVARGKKQCSVGDVEVSPDQGTMAYTVDFTGDEKYSVVFVNLETGKVLDDSISNTDGAVEWGRDNKTVYYGTLDAAHRSDKVWRHTMLDDSVEDECLYTENDETFSAYFGKSMSGRFLFIGTQASTTSEVWFIDLFDAVPQILLIAERVDNVLYTVTHPGGDRFFITTNAENATNFKVIECAVGADRKSWSDLMPYRRERTILGLSCFDKFSVVYGREGGFSALWVMPDHDPASLYRLEVDDEACVVGLGSNLEFETDTFRFVYSSMTTPAQTFDYNTTTRERTLRKETPVPNYDRGMYMTERIMAKSSDGTEIPMSLVWNEKKVNKDEPGFVHLYGYGTYLTTLIKHLIAVVLQQYPAF
jgi:oligopeptidase B